MEEQDSYRPSTEFDESRNGNGGSAPPQQFHKCFVGNLNFRTTWQQLKDHFKQICAVGRVNIFEDRRTRRSKGCGLVEFPQKEDMEKAIAQLNNSNLDGRVITVREDTNDPDQRQVFNRNRDRSNERNDRRRNSRDRDRHHTRDRKEKKRRSYSRSRSSSYSRRRSYSRSRSSSYSSKSYSRDRDRDSRRRYKRSRSRSNPRRRDNRDRDRDRGDRDRRDRRDKKDERGHQILIKNLPWSVTWQQLKDAFKTYGSIIRADIPQDKQGRSAGYGFVRFDREGDARDAVSSMDGAKFNGREISVILCNNNNQH